MLLKQLIANERDSTILMMIESVTDDDATILRICGMEHVDKLDDAEDNCEAWVNNNLLCKPTL